jgi:hypothetical protein
MENLKTERDIADRIIKKHRFEVNRCENWGAAAEHTEARCRREVRASDIIVLIIGKLHSDMVVAEYEEAREWDKRCLVFVKRCANRQQEVQNFVGNKLKKHLFYKEYSNPSELKSYMNSSLSDLIDMMFKSEKERAIIRRASVQCSRMNDAIHEARFVPSGVELDADRLGAMRARLITEKHEVEKILREGL